jgi:hypothetical protein
MFSMREFLVFVVGMVLATLRKAAQSGRPISAAIGRAFIEPFAATDSGPSFPRRWSLPVQLSESEQY